MSHATGFACRRSLILGGTIQTTAGGGFDLPYIGSVNDAGTAFWITNTGDGDAVRGTAEGGGNYGGLFEAYATSGVGVAGAAAGINGIGVYGTAPNSGYAGWFEGDVVLSHNDAEKVRLRGNGLLQGGELNMKNGYDDQTLRVVGHAYGAGSAIDMHDGDGVIAVNLMAGGDSRFVRVFNRDGDETVMIDGHDGDGRGRVKTQILQITGGSDLAEHFDVNGASVQPGMVVCIDPFEAGKLTVAAEPYARTVAGVVSGAGSLRPGMLMSQDGSEADGAYPIALTGRVWTLCDASYGPVKPGDLLTTSESAGHAMKASDPTRAAGTTIGKAMSSLDAGRGLVLVLVSLQ